MNVAAYLDRIGIRRPVGSDAASLLHLHVAHLLSVPFENLSIHWGEPIVLDEEALFDKIVVRRRGGFCYELNGLFAELLRELGFDVDLLAAEVATRDGGYGPPFDHMALRVALAGPWLVDVGFGDSFRQPLRLDAVGEQVQGADAFRIDAVGDRRVLSRRGEGDVWAPQYRFGLEAHDLAEYEPMCRYHQTSPDSHFTQNRVCSLATPSGRITLSGMKLIETEKGVRRERVLADEREYDALLRTRFGISRDR
ncbi:MAG TPA: arylamine N-acetyltransferase [Candidatus Polarisedimenticolaceae bacterium]